jgi:hypothetical protein
MKRPRSLEICGHEFEVKWGPEHTGKKSWGASKQEERWVAVNDEKCVTREQKERTLLHEAIHMILGLTGTVEICEGSERKEEILVTALENGLQPVIRQMVAHGYFHREKSK